MLLDVHGHGVNIALERQCTKSPKQSRKHQISPAHYSQSKNVVGGVLETDGHTVLERSNVG